jgi:hypothetical protein
MQTFRLIITTACLTAFCSVPNIAQSPNWTQFRSPDKTFEIILPAAPEHRSEIIDKSIGKVVTDLWISKFNENSFLVGLTTYPADDDTKTELDLNVLNFAKTSGFEIRDQSDITVDGCSGRQFSGNRGNYEVEGRFLIEGRRRVYTMVVVVPKGDDRKLLTQFIT